jgi:hypothetical protein
MLLIDLIQDFIIELIRTLLIEGLSKRVRKHAEGRSARRRRRRLAERAVHKLVTERRLKQ